MKPKTKPRTGVGITSTRPLVIRGARSRIEGSGGIGSGTEFWLSQEEPNTRKRIQNLRAAAQRGAAPRSPRRPIDSNT